MLAGSSARRDTTSSIMGPARSVDKTITSSGRRDRSSVSNPLAFKLVFKSRDLGKRWLPTILIPLFSRRSAYFEQLDEEPIRKARLPSIRFASIAQRTHE